MIAELGQLLAEAGVTSSFEWRDILVRQNYAPVPRRGQAPATYALNRGFNLVLLSNGQPTLFCKCRPVGDTVVERDTTVRTSLAGFRPHGLSVPAPRIASSKRVALQVTPFLRGMSYGRLAARQSTPRFLAMLRKLLNGLAELASIARIKCPETRSPVATLLVAATAAETLSHAASLAALDPALLAAMTSAIADVGTVPAIPQHGDFWWQNVVLSEGALWVIDFDAYAEVHVPLHDDFTMVCSTLALRRRSSEAGFKHLVAADAESVQCRKLIRSRAASLGLTEAQLDGLLIHHLAHVAVDVTRRGGAVNGAPHVAALRYAAQLLANGRRGLLQSASAAAPR